MKSDFSYNHYEDFLKKALDNNFKFITFKDEFQDKFIILRHDIDYSLEKVLPIAEIENKLNIKSIYFILLEAYNLSDEKNYRILKKILDMEHEIGLHFSPYKDKNDDFNLNLLHKQVKLLSSVLDVDIKCVSMHNSSLSNIRITSESYIDAYSDKFTKQIKYISDSGQFWREKDVIDMIDDFNQFQILIHPIWWSEDNNHLFDILDKHKQNLTNDAQTKINNDIKMFKKYISNLERNKENVMLVEI